jgi:hypothetical protein
MGHKYDEFYRNLCDAKVVTSTAIREAERLGLSTTLDELKDCYGVLHKITNNVITKIEAEHVAGLIERREEKRRVAEQGYSVSSEQYHTGGLPSAGTPRIIAEGRSATISPEFSPSQMVNIMHNCGMSVHVIDEHTDFDQLTRRLNLKENRDDSCAAPAEGHSTPAAADPASSSPEADQGSCGGSE